MIWVIISLGIAGTIFLYLWLKKRKSDDDETKYYTVTFTD